MKRFKLLFVIASILFLTGCSVDYDAKINLDGSIVEKAVITCEKNKLLDSGTDKEYEDYVLEILDADNVNYDDVDIDIEDDNVIVTIKKAYESMKYYLNSSSGYKYLFSNIKKTTDDNYVTINSVPSKYKVLYYDNEGDLNIENSIINISLPYLVTDSNASSVDSNTNVYTWNIDDDMIDSGISIKYNEKKYYTNNIMNLNYYATIATYFNIILVIIIVLVLVVLVIVGIRLYLVQRD